MIQIVHYIQGVREDREAVGIFWVDSDRPGVKPYMVDLLAYRFNGSCDCPDFRDYHEKRTRLENGADPHPALRCKHIERARAWKLEEFLPAWADATGQPIHLNDNNA